MEKKRILIIEDDQDHRELLTEVFSDAGYTVESAVNGKDGLEKAVHGGYTIILLDVMLPILDGIEVLRELKTHKTKAPNGPILLMSNLSDNAVFEEGKKLGAIGHYLKTDSTPDQIIERVQTLIA